MSPLVADRSNTRAFRDVKDFEAWLARNHDRKSELWLRIYKKGTAVRSITHAEALDVALCWGWIDGLRRSFDPKSFLQRFSPRRPKSLWSQVNREHVARLTAAGRMTPHGQKQVDAAKVDGRWAGAYAPLRSLKIADLPLDLRRAIAAEPQAKARLGRLPRRDLVALALRVAPLKTPTLRARRIVELVDLLAHGKPLWPGSAQRQPRG
jgi:uncharacterized protein YdeI (YjbR/CyaY-like superfamily)